MAEAEAAWKARLRQRVVSAHERVRDAREGLQLAKDFYEWPIGAEIEARGPVAFMAAFRAKYSLALWALRAAARHLHSAFVDMEAAETLALRGGNLTGPLVPLLSVQLLVPEDAAWRTALERLHVSRPSVELACEFTDWSLGHLSMALTLWQSTGGGIPDAIALAEREETPAYSALTSAMQHLESVWVKVDAARQILPLAP